MSNKKKNSAAEEETVNTNSADASVKEEKPEEAEKAPAAEEKAALESQLAAEKDKYLRLAAEYDNFRKRSLKEREAIFADVRCDTITKLLPVYDNLERALKQGCSDEAFYKGIEMTMNQLKEIFEKLGIEEIQAAGQVFDPAIHNAVMHTEDENAGENQIVEEFAKGFKLGDKVLRFSMVKVAN